MKCPIEGCNWVKDKPETEDNMARELLRHLSIVARDAHTVEPHEILLHELKALYLPAAR